MTFYMIDVSKFNGSINWPAVRADQNIQGAICKATEGTVDQTGSQTYSVFRADAIAIRAQGFPIFGAYHYLRSGNYVLQAQNFLNTVKAAYGKIDGCLLQLDAEQAGLTLADVRGFLGAWNGLTASYPLVGYFPRWFWEPKVDGAVLNAGFHGWWQSAYVTPNTGNYLAAAGRITSGWNAWDGIAPTILQYGSGMAVPGVAGGCDVNQIKMNLDAFLKQTTRVPAIVVPEVEGEDEVKLIQVEGDNAIWATWGFARRHVGTMAAVGDVERIYGVKVNEDCDPSTLKLYDDLDAPKGA